MVGQDKVKQIQKINMRCKVHKSIKSEKPSETEKPSKAQKADKLLKEEKSSKTEKLSKVSKPTDNPIKTKRIQNVLKKYKSMKKNGLIHEVRVTDNNRIIKDGGALDSMYKLMKRGTTKISDKVKNVGMNVTAVGNKVANNLTKNKSQGFITNKEDSLKNKYFTQYDLRYFHYLPYVITKDNDTAKKLQKLEKNNNDISAIMNDIVLIYPKENPPKYKNTYIKTIKITTFFPVNEGFAISFLDSSEKKVRYYNYNKLIDLYRGFFEIFKDRITDNKKINGDLETTQNTFNIRCKLYNWYKNSNSNASEFMHVKNFNQFDIITIHLFYRTFDLYVYYKSFLSSNDDKLNKIKESIYILLLFFDQNTLNCILINYLEQTRLEDSNNYNVKNTEVLDTIKQLINENNQKCQNISSNILDKINPKNIKKVNTGFMNRNMPLSSLKTTLNRLKQEDGITTQDENNESCTV